MYMVWMFGCMYVFPKIYISKTPLTLSLELGFYFIYSSILANMDRIYMNVKYNMIFKQSMCSLLAFVGCFVLDWIVAFDGFQNGFYFFHNLVNLGLQFRVDRVLHFGYLLRWRPSAWALNGCGLKSL